MQAITRSPVGLQLDVRSPLITMSVRIDRCQIAKLKNMLTDGPKPCLDLKTVPFCVARVRAFTIHSCP